MKIIPVFHMGYRYRDERGSHEPIYESEVAEMIKHVCPEPLFSSEECLKQDSYKEDAFYLHINPQKAMTYKELGLCL